MHIENEILITDIPRECVADCTVGGVDAFPVASEWVDKLSFEVDRKRALYCLDQYGAWEKEELEAESDRGLAIKILWLACGDFSEWYACADAEGITADNIPDDFRPNCGSDFFSLC